MSTPTNLLTLEVGGGCEVLETIEYELSSSQETTEEIVLISGTLTVSP